MANSDPEFIIITQADVADYAKYSTLPLEKLDHFKDLIYPRMVHYKGGFRSHYDLINDATHGQFYTEADFPQRRDLLNIWNLPGCSGLLVANVLESHGIPTKIINNFDSEWDLFEQTYTQAKSKPLVGLSSTFYLSYSTIRRITKKLRKLDKDMTIILGGAFANEQEISFGIDSFEKHMQRCGIDFVIHSFNSEHDLVDLVKTLRNHGDVSKIKNITYFANGTADKTTFHKTEKKWHNPLLNDSPILWNQLDLPSLNRTIQMRTASGCPFSCAFCSYPETAGGHFALDIDLVEKNIQNILSIPGVDRIIFIDDTFNVPIKRFKEMCHIFNKYEFDWFSFYRVQYLDDETAALMKESGCRGLYLGLESSSDVILKNMNKKATREGFLKGLELLNKYDISSMAAFIVGYPGETDETIQENIDFIETSGIDFYCLKEFYYMHHTSVHRDREKWGLTGEGADWKHDTMDYPTAHQKKVEMFQTIKNSIYVDPDTSLWYLAYLYDQGYDMETIKLMQKSINTIMSDQMKGQFDDKHPAYDDLKRHAQKRNLLRV